MAECITCTNHMYMEISQFSGKDIIVYTVTTTLLPQPLFSLSYPLPSSAGIGRTGAFCALSTAIERVKAEGIVDVFHTVKHLRTQRPHMVQTVVSS